ncbi:MAG: BlaI/MecI/CopY family transcriptional regulator [Candidatus Eisenbacteria bacterium]|uniref:BlaI/MecI/CopY family transcriptional regulator n=1 Tax=Eiseniibacteriota bacterium TaxID=2212470 RepID=A0A7Y2E7A9_UNCEI|nr:BlaI/MecI/CopY family transcriptional regulator [Candidatus Eisenbacteria bacterium]
MSENNQLSGLQLAIMRVLWDRGEATVADVHEVLHRDRGLAPTTVATILTRLEKRDLLSHRREGRQFIYKALVSEDEVRKSMVSELTDRVFQGNVAELVGHLLSEQEITAGDLEVVKQLIEKKAKTHPED